MICPHCKSQLKPVIYKNIEINLNDFHILYVLREKPLSCGDVAKKVGIAYKNLYLRIKFLKEQKLISVLSKGRGRKTYLSLKEDFSDGM